MPALKCKIPCGGTARPLFLLASFALATVFALSISNDEQSTAYVVKSWADGQVAYRDFFDNHTPLFHLLSVPIFRLLHSIIGDDARLLFGLRLFELTIVALNLLLLHRLQTRLQGKSIRFTVILLYMAIPPVMITSLQFRPDILWCSVWLGSLLIITDRKLGSRRFIYSGLLLGIAFLISMKTILLLATLLSSHVLLHFATGGKNRAPAKEQLAKFIGFLLGFLFPLIIGATLLRHLDAWDSFINTNVHHNLSAGIASRFSFTFLHYVYPLVLVPLFFLTRALLQRHPFVVVMMVLLCANYLLLLICYWPLIENQTLLPGLALLALCLVYFLQDHQWLLALTTAMGLLSIPLHPRINPHSLKRTLHQNRIAMTLTDPTDYVLSSKGEIFLRPRPSYTVYERITRARIAKNIQSDETPNDLKRTATKVIARGIYFSAPSTRYTSRFFKRNYLQTRHGLAIAGSIIGPTSSKTVTIYTDIAAEYLFLSRDGVRQFIVDGRKVDGAVSLTAGKHRITWQGESAPCLYIWERAYRKKLIDERYCRSPFYDERFYSS